MYERVGIMKVIAMTMFNSKLNRRLAMCTIMFVFGVISAPRPVFADTINITRTSGNGIVSPATPLNFGGHTAQFDKTLRDLNDFYIEIVVEIVGDRISAVFILDERVFNNTGLTWQDYHFTLGTGGFDGKPFVESTEMDNLFFLIADPNAPVNFGLNFNNPPTLDEVVDPDNLSWFAGTGVAPGAFTSFRVAINVPDALDGVENDLTVFTLRQRATVPEPTTMLLLGTGLAGVAIKTRNKLKHRKSG